MKLAICYFGLTRATKKVYESHHERVFNILTQNNIDFKIFMHTWKTKDNTQYVWNDIVKQTIDYDEYKLLTPDYYRIDSQDYFTDRLKITKYFYPDVWKKIGHCKEGEWLPRLLVNYLCALESQKRVVEMVEQSGYNPDILVIIRPDCLIHNDFPIKEIIDYLKKNENGIILPNFDHFEGYNDRFSITNFKNCKYYGKSIKELPEFRKNHGRIVAEKYTKYICDKYYKPHFINFRFTLMRP